MHKKQHEMRRQLNHYRKLVWKLGSDLIDARNEIKNLHVQVEEQKRYYEDLCVDILKHYDASGVPLTDD